jgi:hypothetical protein
MQHGDADQNAGEQEEVDRNAEEGREADGIGAWVRA